MSFNNEMSGSFYPMEASAREIAANTIGREGDYFMKQLSTDQQHELIELLTSAVHDGIEFGESVAALPDGAPTKLEHYTRGYTDAIEDLIMKQGEQ